MAAGVAQVGEQAQVGCAIGATQLQWFSRVMGHREGQRAQRAEVDRLHVMGHAQQSIQIWGAQCGVGSEAHPHGNAVPQGQIFGAADMVGMFVGDENGIDLVDAQPRRTKPGGEFPDAEAAVDQQATDLQSIASFHHGGIA
jgi:hypothetical protein